MDEIKNLNKEHCEVMASNLIEEKEKNQIISDFLTLKLNFEENYSNVSSSAILNFPSAFTLCRPPLAKWNCSPAWMV